MVTSTLPYIEVEISATTIAWSIGCAINHFVLRKTISVSDAMQGRLVAHDTRL
jgi:hypothetical protein